MHVGIVEPRDDSPPFEVDPSGRAGAGVAKLFAPDGRDASAGHGNCRDLGMSALQGGDLAVVQNQVGCIHSLASFGRIVAGPGPRAATVAPRLANDEHARTALPLTSIVSAGATLQCLAF